MTTDSAGFLPVNKNDMTMRGWDEVDFAFVSGDAYVDHPSFAHAVISRVLEKAGFRVGIIAQPKWNSPDSLRVFGRPRLGFLICGGNMDSMVNHYSVAKLRRKTDSYSPGGQMGLRPDYAVTVYSKLARKAYPDVPIILGGIEASLRRLAHYDYWSDSLKRSVLLDSDADILLYGMGERSAVAVAKALEAGTPVREITDIAGSVWRTASPEGISDYIALPSYDKLLSDKKEYAKSFAKQYANTDPYAAKALVERYSADLYVVQNPPQKPLSTPEMDAVYALPYMRTYHPMYEKSGGIPAIDEVKFSLISNRGCFGGCSFCALTFHQGRIVQVRSHESIIEEARQLTRQPDFKGYIHDVGGPTANFRRTACEKQKTRGACPNRQCLAPDPCPNLVADHGDYLELLRELRELPKVKKVFVRSGLRFDYILLDRDDTFLKELVAHHISGQLKVAPEHISDSVLRMMGKPRHSVYERFLAKYKKLNEKYGLKQYVVPYLMSSHPGSTIKDAVALAEYLRGIGYMPEQVQDFYPTPSTISTCMYYTGLDPRTMEPVYVPRSPHEKAMQRALIQYRNPKNYALVHEALVLAGRRDLIGYEKNCLIHPKRSETEADRPLRRTGKGEGRGGGKVDAKRDGKADAKRGGKADAKRSGKADAKRSGRAASPHGDAAKRGGKTAPRGRQSGGKHRG